MSTSSPRPADNNDANNRNPLSLIHAMKLADVIRKHYDGTDNNNNNNSVSVPPGTFQGIAAFVVTGVALLPIRRLILRSAGNQPGGKPFQHFVDIVISVGHALACTQAGFLIGSLYGSQTYLNLLQREPPTSNSPLTDKVCQTMWSDVLPPQYVPSKTNLALQYSSQFDPRMQTMTALQNAIASCQRRKAFQQATST